MRILGQKPVTRMDGLDVANFRSADDPVDLEVAFLAGRIANANCLIRQLHVQRVGIRFRINSQRTDTQFFAGANDSHSDFTAIGYEDFVEHGGVTCRNRNRMADALLGAHREQFLTKFHGLGVFSHNFSDDATHFGLDLIHHLHRLNDANDCLRVHNLADFDIGRRIR